MIEIDTKFEKNRKSTVFIFVFSVIYLFFLFRTVFDPELNPPVFDDTKKYVGIYLNDPMVFQNSRVRPDIMGWFELWHGRISTAKLDLCESRNFAIPMITWEPHNVRLNDIASGTEDEYIRSFLQTVRDHTPHTDVLIRFAHEMEMRPSYSFSWYSWQGERDPEAYINAWRHVVTLGREIDPSIKWIWAPNRSDEYSAPFYPGDDYVDYVGITMNLPEDDEYYGLYRTFRDFYVMDGTREHLESYGKKIIIAEAGYSNDEIENRRKFMRSTFDYLPEDPNIAGLLFYNSSMESVRDYNITRNPVLMEEFKAGLERIHASFR